MVYIDLDYFVVTEATFDRYPFENYVDIEIKAHAHVSIELYNQWVKNKSEDNVKLKEITDGH